MVMADPSDLGHGKNNLIITFIAKPFGSLKSKLKFTHIENNHKKYYYIFSMSCATWENQFYNSDLELVTYFMHEIVLSMHSKREKIISQITSI